ncbi:Stk1 family PASTA domain-containing Ser/Thr kinase [Oerskovia sp. KBS0722]|uniref:Stk1 family PASTA domain-containing Ser/Thr kinase n=1 Tax=Oerskovia sp. KBS0722 TaxID=1179673 RepID=UPI00110DE0BC|nr:Stk1 family PASTA domain-containing Ser/Thr kinase [Oerskovia sp. KBS0722]QDW63582.1 Stk1 family PASTA domain-containing Ser/Thr kinase [Oerskovia sp. KBS0722]
MATVTSDPFVGRLVDGRYHVVSRIARGGMATVYLAVDRRLDREVALKVMHPHLAEGTDGGEFVARFRREARAAARLAHPGVVAVFDQGVDGETSYLTMEYVPGTNLRHVLQDEGSLSVGRTLDLLEEILDALAAAHRKGLVHRDVKPENVLLDESGRVKVADFGLARAVSEGASTATSTILGTVAYLGPELITSGRCDARTDVYSVGVLAYEMLTGRHPFTGETPLQVAFQHVNSDVPAPSDVEPWIPAEVDVLVCALAARSPEDRPVDASAALALVRQTRQALDPAALEGRSSRATGTTATSGAEPSPSAGSPDTAVLGVATAALAGALARPGDTPSGTTGTPAPSTAPDSTPTTALPGLWATRDEGAPQTSDRAATQHTLALDRATLAAHGDAPGSEDGPEDEVLRRAGRRRRAWWWGLAIVVLLAGALTGASWWFLSGPGAYTIVPGGLVGAPQAGAEQTLAAVDLRSDVTEAYDDTFAAGTVISTDPGAGEKVRKDGEVHLLVSLGVKMIEIPTGLVGKPAGEATEALKDAGFTVGEPVEAYSDTVPAGTVVSVSEAEGTSVPHSTVPVLTVSQGPAPVTIPQVVGLGKDAALTALTDLGLDPSSTDDYSETVAAGLVISQTPENGTEGHRGDKVALVVSLGPPLVEIPNTYGRNVTEAEKMLKDAGFAVEVRHPQGISPLNIVYAQDPAGGAGKTAPKGSTIVINVF